MLYGEKCDGFAGCICRSNDYKHVGVEPVFPSEFKSAKVQQREVSVTSSHGSEKPPRGQKQANPS